MQTYLQYIKNRQVINEGFSEKEIDKAISLIKNVLKKHIDNDVLEVPGFINTKSKGDNLYTKEFMVIAKDKSVQLIHINWLKSSSSYEPYSIDIFNDLSVLLNNAAKAKITLYTLGSSIVYFLPMIWTIVNTKNYNMSEKEITELNKKIFKDPNIKESFAYIGALEYRIIENIDNEILKKSFNLFEGALPNKKVREYEQKKREEVSAAFKKRNNSEEDKKRYQELELEYSQIRSAIMGGAHTLGELRMAINRNVNVTVELDQKMQDVEQKFKEEREDPEIVFKKMQGYIKMVMKGINPSVILCGAPGVGKTFRVKKQLKANNYNEGHNLFTIKGKCTPRRLYLTLYEFKNKGQIILIDDADGLVGPNAPEDCINILKAALDSTADDEGRLVSYGISGKILDDDGNEIPKRFYFNAGVIVITNWNAGKLDTALRGRSYIQDINFTTEEILEIIRKLMPEIDPEHISKQSKNKAYEYLKELVDNEYDVEVSIRTFGICAKIFEAIGNDDEFTDEDAKSMIKEQMKLQASKITGKGGKY